MRRTIVSFLSLCFILPMGAISAFAAPENAIKESADPPSASPMNTLPLGQRVVVVPRRRRPVLVRRRRLRRGYVGLNGGFSYVFGSDQRLDNVARSGGMVEVFAGWRIGRFLGLEGAFMLAMHSNDIQSQKDSLVFGVTGSAKFYLMPNARRVRPYALLGVGAYGATGILRASNPNKVQGEGALGFGLSVGVGGVSVAV